MFHSQANDIRVKMNDRADWEPAPQEWVAAYMNYKSRPGYGSSEIPVSYNNQLTVFRANNDCYMPTRIRRTDAAEDDAYPIMDCADVKVFLQDAEPANWYPARNYQMWAFRDFVNDPAHPVRKFYASKYSSHLFFQRGALDQHDQPVVYIDIDDLSPNIIFSISRNDNNSVYYERNDASRTRVRICDHEGARAGFRGFYTRITMDPGIIVFPPHAANHNNDNTPQPLLLPPSMTTSQTNDEDEQCIMCYENRKNLEFAPCAHFVVCHACYVKFEKPRECPMCKCDIVSLIDRA